MKLSVVTPTCDRPAAMSLAERWMSRQTRPPNEWIVVDGGTITTPLTMDQHVIRRVDRPGPRNFTQNLLDGVAVATGDVIAIWEDDDYYAPTHLACLVAQLAAQPNAWLTGDDQQRYYNVSLRRWKIFQNRGASLCQTAFRRVALPTFLSVVHQRYREAHYGVDGLLWASVPKARWHLVRTQTVCGMKGLPGQVGLGVGHRQAIVTGWQGDPTGRTLRAWLGDDAEIYLQEQVA